MIGLSTTVSSVTEYMVPPLDIDDTAAAAIKQRVERQQRRPTTGRPGGGSGRVMPPSIETTTRLAEATNALEYLQLEIERHGTELELLRRHVQQMNMRLSNIGPGQPGPLGAAGYPGQKVPSICA
jgi:hypothetical protein